TLPPPAQPVFLFKNKIERIGHGPSIVRPLQVSPPLVVTCSQPSTLGEISPPPTHPSLSLRKKTGPSKTESTELPQVHSEPPVRLVQKLMPDARAWRLLSNENCGPNQPPSALATALSQSERPAPPSLVYSASVAESSPAGPNVRIKPSCLLTKRTCCNHSGPGLMSLLQALPPSSVQRKTP